MDRVVSAATRLKGDPDRRRRVTVRAISLELGLHPFLQRYKHRLPRTKSALEVQVESTEQFTLLRIRRAANAFVTNRTCATRSDILRAAGIAGSTANRIPSVQLSVTRAKEYLDRHADHAGLST